MTLVRRNPMVRTGSGRGSRARSRPIIGLNPFPLRQRIADAAARASNFNDRRAIHQVWREREMLLKALQVLASSASVNIDDLPKLRAAQDLIGKLEPK